MANRGTRLTIRKTICLHYLTGLLVLCLQHFAHCDVCTVRSNSFTNQSVPYTTSGQYIDLDNTVPCNGNITSIQYCSFLDNETDFDNQTAKFSVRIWRESNGTFVRIHEISIYNATAVNHSNSTVCNRVTINETMEVVTGDILGMYFESPFILVATSTDTGARVQVSGASQQPGGGLYFDTRQSTEARYGTTLTPADISANTTLQYHIQLQIRNELISPQQTLSPTPSQTSSHKATAQYNKTQTYTPAEPAEPTTSTQMIPTMQSTAVNTASGSKAPPTNSLTVPISSPVQNTLVTPSSTCTQSTSINLIESTTTHDPELSSTHLVTFRPTMSSHISSTELLAPSKLPEMPGPTTPPKEVISSEGLVAGLTGLFVFLVLVVAVVIVVCSLLVRARRSAVHSNKNAFIVEEDRFVFRNVECAVPVDDALVTANGIHIANGSKSQVSSQGSLLENKDLTSGNSSSQNKHTSVHLYSTIETLKRTGNLQGPFMRTRVDNLLRNKTAARSLESLEASTRTTSSVPTEYEVPLSLSVSRCSSNCTVQYPSSMSAASSTESILEELLSTHIELDKWRKQMNVPLRNRTESQSRSRGSMDGPYSSPPTTVTDLYKKLRELSVEFISTEDVKTDLGMIQPSLVTQKAVLKRKSGQRDRQVTIKAPDPAESEKEGKILLLQEAVIMGQIRHPNVVQLHGVIVDDNKVMMVMEQFPKEDLRRYLVQMGRSVIHPDAPKLLLNFSQQVALGMHYLSSKGFVHRDLAARNIFVTKNDMCKVGELAKCMEYADPEQYVLRGGKLPIRWMPPEAMYRKRYSTASDVWSYGCLLYEIWSLGRMPFREYTNAQVIEKVDFGYRIPPPPGCPKLIYDLMIQCWHPNPLSRPTFKELLNSLLGDETHVLQIPMRDAATHEAAILLGAELEAGKFLYRDLQTKYMERHALHKPVQMHHNTPTNGIKARSKSPQPPRPTWTSDYDHISHNKVVMTAFPTSSADIDYMYKGHKPEQRNGLGAVEDDFDPATTSFRQRLLTDDKSDYVDIGD